MIMLGYPERAPQPTGSNLSLSSTQGAGVISPLKFSFDVEDGFEFRAGLLQLTKIPQHAGQIVAGGQGAGVVSSE